MALAVLISAVLATGPLTISTATSGNVIVGLLVAIVFFLLFQKAVSGNRLAILKRLTVTNLAFSLIVIASYWSDLLSHYLVVSGDWGLLLLTFYLVIQVALLAQPAISEKAFGAGFGGLSGVSITIIINVAAFPGPITPAWVLVSFVIGAIVVFLINASPPQPVRRSILGIPFRALPLSISWIGAFAVGIPSSPRHELASSAGVQTLVCLLALCTVGWMILVWNAKPDRTEGFFATTMNSLSSIASFIVPTSLLVLGGLQAASYSAVTTDDLGRYWSVADSLLYLGKYPVWNAQAFGWMDLPTFPLLIAASFQLLGHSYAAALAPLAAANCLLPFVMYRASLSWGIGRITSFAVAVIVVVAPPVQIHSLGSAEPDAIFIVVMAGCLWLLGASVGDRRTLPYGIALGILAGVLVLTRPEGTLYAATILGVAILIDRSRWSLVVLAAATILVAPFVFTSLDQLGRPWPINRQDIGISNLISNVDLVKQVTWEKLARVVLLNDIRFPLLMGTILFVYILGSAIHIKRCVWVALLPIAVALNVLVTLSVPADTVRSDELDEFIRHLAYPIPVIALFAAAGLTEIGKFLSKTSLGRLKLSLMGPALAIWIVAGSLYLLATPEEFHHGNRSGSLLTADIYINVPELWGSNIDLPCPPCLGAQWDFSTFRNGLFSNYRPFDAHSMSDGAAYQTISGLSVALGFLVLLAPSRRLHSSTTGQQETNSVARARLKCSHDD